MKQLNAIGHHCYFGGFLLGLQRAGVTINSTRETWLEGGRMARKLRLPVVLGGEPWQPKRADIVVANPPCSRFSVLAAMTYKEEHRTNCDCFAELLDLHHTVEAVQPKLFWWETGPMARKQGLPMIRTHHGMMQKTMASEDITTLIIYYDCRFAGLPQRRPRTHILHFKDKMGKRLMNLIVPGPTPTPNAAQFLKSVKGKRQHPITPSEYLSDSQGAMATKARKAKATTPLKFAQWAWSAKGYRFMAQRPNIIDASDSFFPAVITDVCHVVMPDDRWFDLREAAALMDYPVEEVLALTKQGHSPRQLLKLLSKSVSPSASEFIMNAIARPTLENTTHETESDGDCRRVKDFGEGVYYLDLSVGDRIKRKTTEATREFIAKRSIDPPDRIAKLAAMGKRT